MSTLEPVHQSLEVSAQILGVLKQRANEDRELELHIEAATWKVTAAMHKFSADTWHERVEQLETEIDEMKDQQMEEADA